MIGNHIICIFVRQNQKNNMMNKKLICLGISLYFSLTSFSQVNTFTVTTTGEKIKIDPVELFVTATPNYTQSGRTVVNGQSTFFGWFMMAPKTEDVQARLSLWDGDKLVELSDIHSFKISNNGNNGRRIPFYIKAPAGRYRVKPLIRQLDKDYWTIPEDQSPYEDFDDIFSYKNWEYNIEDRNAHKAPGILLLRSEGLSEELVGGIGIPTLFNEAEQRKQFERFDIHVRMSNNSDNAIKGKLKILWERDFNKFWLGYSHSVPVLTNWSDCISKGATMNGFTDWNGTGLPVEIPARTADIRFDIKGCYASTYYEWGTMYTPYAHVYFQPEGTNQWILCGVNAAGDYDASGVLIPSVYQHNCNSFALWISKASDESANPETVKCVYKKNAKTITFEAMPAKTYIYLYKSDGATVVAEAKSTNGSYSINTATISPGSYLLKIINGTAVKTIKIIL